MAFPQPNVQRDLASRKILEELQLKKQILLKQGVASTLNSQLPVLGSPNVTSGDAHSMASVQRAALQTANAQSTGYFISQDSSFVNIRMWPCMKLRHIEEVLQGIDEFKQPKILLEQYITPPHLASHILYTVQSQYGDITGKVVGDLGSGCGMLTIGAAAMDAAYVMGFEIDPEAINLCCNNIDFQELTNIEIVNCNVQDIPSRFNKVFDSIIMNPPFGTKHNQGIDMAFLKKAFELSRHSVYSLHKRSTRSHVIKVAQLNSVKAEVLAELRYDLPSTFKFHKKKSVDIEVDFFRFELSNC